MQEEATKKFNHEMSSQNNEIRESLISPNFKTPEVRSPLAESVLESPSRNDFLQVNFVEGMNEDDKSGLIHVIKNDEEDSDWSKQDDSYD